MITTPSPSKSRSGSIQRAKKLSKVDTKKPNIDINLSPDGEVYSMRLFDANMAVSQLELTELLKAITILILTGHDENKHLVSIFAMLQAANNIDVTADDRAYIAGVVKLFEGTNPTSHLWCRDDTGCLMVLPTNRHTMQ